MIKIIIDPRSSYAYGSFYVLGMNNIFGSKNVQYSIKPFKSLGTVGSNLRFLLVDGDKQTKYFIQADDEYHIIPSVYEWCDVYGHVNSNYIQNPRSNYPKVISLAPSFGIRVDEKACYVMLSSLIQLPSMWPYILNASEWNKYTQRMECNRVRNLKHYFGRRYRAWKNRLPLSSYEHSIQSEDNYIFFLSTLWYNNQWNKNDEGVNLRRAHFIRACKSIHTCQFEGGLLGDASSSNDLFADVYTAQGVAFPDWIEKTKRSALVFNTPAFWDCHGWKLGEYLALGKCIISTKLSNDLPYPLEHGVNIHFVDNTEESMREAIEYILAHPDYRHKLEKGAREYWEKYGTPEASLRLLGIEKS